MYFSTSGGKYMYQNIHQSAICNGRKLEPIQMCIKSSMGELIVFIMEEDRQGSHSVLCW